MSLINNPKPSILKKITKIFTPFTVILIVLVFVFAGLAGYFYYSFEQVKANPNLIYEQEIQSIVEKISTFMELPSGEPPTLATVKDHEKLKEQQFFQKAQNGDKILIYREARKAILYRPSTDKVVETATFSIEDLESDGSTPEVSLDEPVSIAIYNGAQINNFAAITEEKLQDIENLNVIQKVNSRRTYSETRIVNLTDQPQSVLDLLIQRVGGSIGTMPSGEATPEADILIIAADESTAP